MKTTKQLTDDILYFFKTFPGPLKAAQAEWSRMSKTQKQNEAVLKRTHQRIVGILQPQGAPKEDNREVLEVLAEKFIESKMAELMAQSAFANLQPAAVVNAEGVADQQQKSKDMGAFEVRAGLRGGKNFIQREPVYKAIATTQPDIVREQMMPPGQATQPKRFSLMPAKQINLATTAKRFNRDNPFARRQDTIELRVLK